MRFGLRWNQARTARAICLASLAVVVHAATGQPSPVQPSTPQPRPAQPSTPQHLSPRVADPAPPAVRGLAPAEPPAASAHPGLTFHGAPRKLAAGAVTGDWPCLLGASRDAHVNETKLLGEWPPGGPRLLWEMTCGQGYASPVIAGRRLVYTHRVRAQVHVDCLDAESGRRFWRHSVPCDFRGRYISDNGPRSTPVIDGDRVLVHGVDNKLVCLDLATGREIWKRDLAGEFGIPDDFFGVVPSPLVHDGLLIQNIGAPGGPCVAAFDVGTGRLVWGAGKAWGPSCASPVIASVHGRERLFVLAGGESRPPTGGLMVIDPGTGSVEFEYPFRSRTYESVLAACPVVVDDAVFITASYNTGSAVIDVRADGTYAERWKNRRFGLQFSNPVALHGNLYMIDGVSDRAGAIVRLDPRTGEISRTDLGWEEVVYYKGTDKSRPFSIGEGSLLVADGRLLCLGDNGHLLWLDASPDGLAIAARASLFRASETWTPPAISRGLLYVCQNTRERFGRAPAPPRLLCFDLRGE